MNVRMVGEVITKGVNAQEDTCFSFWNSCRGGQAFGEGIGYDAAEHGQALGVSTENIPQNARDSEDPVTVRDRETDIGGNGSCRIHRAALVTGRADSTLLAGEGKQVCSGIASQSGLVARWARNVVAVVATHAQESLAEVAAAQKTVKCVLQFWPEWSQCGLVLGGVVPKEIVEGGFQALPEGRGFGLARAVRLAHSVI